MANGTVKITGLPQECERNHRSWKGHIRGVLSRPDKRMLSPTTRDVCRSWRVVPSHTGRFPLPLVAPFWGARGRRTWGVEVKIEPQSHYFDLLCNLFDLEAHNTNLESYPQYFYLSCLHFLLFSFSGRKGLCLNNFFPSIHTHPWQFGCRWRPQGHPSSGRMRTTTPMINGQSPLPT